MNSLHYFIVGHGKWMGAICLNKYIVNLNYNHVIKCDMYGDSIWAEQTREETDPSPAVCKVCIIYSWKQQFNIGNLLYLKNSFKWNKNFLHFQCLSNNHEKLKISKGSTLPLVTFLYPLRKPVFSFLNILPQYTSLYIIESIKLLSIWGCHSLLRPVSYHTIIY